MKWIEEIINSFFSSLFWLNTRSEKERHIHKVKKRKKIVGKVFLLDRKNQPSEKKGKHSLSAQIIKKKKNSTQNECEN